MPRLLGKRPEKVRKPLLLVLGRYGYNRMGMAHFITHANRTSLKRVAFGSISSVRESFAWSSSTHVNTADPFQNVVSSKK